MTTDTQLQGNPMTTNYDCPNCEGCPDFAPADTPVGQSGTLPEQFICVSPDNGPAARSHVGLCLYCQEILKEELRSPVAAPSNDQIFLKAFKGCGCDGDLVWCTACVNKWVREVRDAGADNDAERESK